jgi:DnaJ-domain-containing protein 1
MYYNIAYPLFSSPSGGSYNKLPEIYTEWEKEYNERINREKEEMKAKSQADYDKFKNFFNQNFEDYGKRENPLDFDYKEQDDEYPHSVFGLKKSASQEDMKNAYRKAIRETHPDKTGENTEDEFREIQEAYEHYNKFCI